MEGYVKAHNEHGINTIEFYHPQSNSLPGKILEQIAQEIHYSCSEDTKVVILKSGGTGAFCAGASFDELSSLQTEKDGHHFFNGFAAVINAMRKCNKLVIGRIHGKCVGGGVGIAAACDYAIATQRSEVKLSELAMGIGPFVVGPAIERKIGLSAFSQLAIDSSLWRTADWAKVKGLFAEVHPTVEDMDDSIYRLSNMLAHSNPTAMSEMKKIFWKGTEHWDDLLRDRAAISGKLVLTNYSKDAINAFKSKMKM
ncbi:MAG: enoyl-CoA hydratase/isomerase family protein [Ginsengibacter sp.]